MSDSCDIPENSTFDLAVIGAGSADFSAAITAAEDGARVALIGHGTIGGTCVDFGCVPSKALIGALSRCIMPQLRSASTVSKRPHASPSGKPLFGKNKH